MCKIHDDLADRDLYVSMLYCIWIRRWNREKSNFPKPESLDVYDPFYGIYWNVFQNWRKENTSVLCGAGCDAACDHPALHENLSEGLTTDRQ